MPKKPTDFKLCATHVSGSQTIVQLKPSIQMESFNPFSAWGDHLKGI